MRYLLDKLFVTSSCTIITHVKWGWKHGTMLKMHSSCKQIWSLHFNLPPPKDCTWCKFCQLCLLFLCASKSVMNTQINTFYTCCSNCVSRRCLLVKSYQSYQSSRCIHRNKTHGTLVFPLNFFILCTSTEHLFVWSHTSSMNSCTKISLLRYIVCIM